MDVGGRFALADIAEAHDRVDAGGRGRVLVTVPGCPRPWIQVRQCRRDRH
ncbi:MULTISPECIES: hypothetical protein [Streptomyces]